jgi:hypothetical protein
VSGSISTRSRDAPVIADVDVVVAGGGSAGLAAAISAARTGARTALIERYGFFGGNAVSAYVGTICGLYYYEGDEPAYVCRGFAQEWAEALVSHGAAFGPVPFKETAVLLYVPWMYKRLGDRLVREETGLVPLLHAPIVDAYLDGGELRGVVIGGKRGPLAVLGKVFVDATGDADLATFAGERVELSPAGKRQFPSMQFLVENVDFEATRTAALERLSSSTGEVPDAKAMSGAVTAHLSELLSTVGQEPRWNMGRRGGAVFPTFREGEVLWAMTRVTTPDGEPPDMTDPFEATAAEMNGRDEAERAHEFLKENLTGFEGSFLADTPTQLGVRETRRVAGEYVLTHDDVVGAARFEDSIGCGAWPEEFHWEGKGTDYVWLPAGAYYQMPYRMLLAGGLENLLVAGRCSSASPEALASTRVIAPSMVQGQGAGTAAALAATAGVGPKELDPVDLQKALIEAGAFLG